MISIVMPVYNTGKYLEESLQSILSQSYTDFELICVDDCSSDELTKKILYEYNSKDNRIKVLSMEQNVGAAEARNIGMDHAKGTYLVFLDGDDIFHKDMLMNAYTTIEKYDADMCVWGYRTFCTTEEEKKILHENCPIRIDNRTDGIFKVSDLPENGLNLWTTGPWTKLCKKAFLVDNNIRFQTLKCSNDVFYSIMCAVCAKKIVYVEGEQILVNYRTGSGMQISSNRDPRCVCDAVEQILINIQRNTCLDRQILYAFLNMLIYEFRNSHNELWREESYYRIRAIIKSYFENVLLENNAYNVLRQKIENLDYRYGQVFLNAVFEEQLRSAQDELKKEIGQVKELVVWGRGKRGKAFINIIELFDCEKVMIVDSRNDEVGTVIYNGIPIIHTDEVKGRECLIVATNTHIYNYIKNLDDFNCAKVINIEPYCPVG